MTKITRLLLLPVLALAIVAAGCGGDTQDVPSNAVAVVDGTAITKASLDALIGRAKITYKDQSRTFPKAGTTEYQSLQQQAVAYLVKRVEYDQEAAALDVEVTDKQIADSVAQIRKQYYDNSEKKFRAQVKKLGFTDETLREELRSNLVSDGLFAAVTKDVKVPDVEVKKYYAENKATYTTPESREVRHILVAKKDLALQIRKQLVDGADFGALAKKYSKDTGSASLGGKYTVTKGQTVAPFEKASFSLKTNEISQPVKTQFGYHIIQPTGDLKKASVTPFASVKQQITTQLLDSRKQEAMVKWDDELVKEYKSKVAYADGYAPPEAATTPASTADES